MKSQLRFGIARRLAPVLAFLLLLPLHAVAGVPEAADAYAQKVFEKLQRQWQQDTYDQKVVNSVLRLVLNDEGQPVSIHLEAASTDAHANRDLLKRVRAALPFSPFPKELTGRQLTFRFRFLPNQLVMSGYEVLSRPVGDTSLVTVGQGVHLLQPTLIAPPVVADGTPLSADEQTQAAYIEQVQAQIHHRWQALAVQPATRAVARLSIDRDGRLLGVVIRQSSGQDSVDKAALKAIHQAAPFPPVPGAFQTLPLQIEYTFDPATNEPTAEPAQ